MHPYVHRSPIYNSQHMETNYMPINRWIEREDAVCIHSGILRPSIPLPVEYYSHKKEQKNAICSNMGGPRDYHTK